MACHVGMSTKPGARIQYRKAREGDTRSKILASGLTYSQARKHERRAAQDRGCRHSGGGQPVAGKVWYVYLVWGGRQASSEQHPSVFVDLKQGLRKLSIL